MGVPNTDTFTLDDVLQELGLGDGDSLQDCFDDAVSSDFDGNYNPNSTGTSNNLLNFRNYANAGLTAVLSNNNLSGSSSWNFFSLDVSSYAGSTAKLVIEYTSGTSYTGDFQIGGNIVAGSTTWNPNTGLNNFQTSTSSVTTYASVSWMSMQNATSAGRWNRRTGNTPSGGTGVASSDPPVGYFYYAETSSGAGYPNKKIWLRSPSFSITNSNDTIEFYMGHLGATVNNFKIYLDIQ